MPSPAFPTTRDNAAESGSSGMELRDYFAAQAMAAIIIWDVHREMDEQAIAMAAYTHADSMLIARMRSNYVRP